MKGSHWTALGMFLGAVALDLESAPTWAAMLTPSWFGSLGLHIAAICTALGARSVFAAEPTKLDSLRGLPTIGT